MKPAAFDYHRPQSVAEALAVLARLGGEAKPLAGGQSLGPMLNMRVARPRHIVDLNDLLELDYLRDVDGAIEIGGLTRHHRIATAPEVQRANPLLAAAAATIGHYAIRQRGTLAGSLVHADPAAQLSLVAVSLEAELDVQSTAGLRQVAARNFLQSIMTVDLHDGELVTAVRFPKLGAGTGWGFELFSRRRGDFAIAAVAATVTLDPEGAIAALRIGLGGVGPVPLRRERIESESTGIRPGANWPAATAQRICETTEIEEEGRVSAAFRRDLVRALSERALTKALERAGRA